MKRWLSWLRARRWGKRRMQPQQERAMREKKPLQFHVGYRDLNGWELAERREYAVKPRERKDGL